VHQARIALLGFCVLAGNTYQLSARADDQSLEEIVVTGTRIARSDFSSASPIASVPAVAFTRRASTTVETTLNEMPQLVPSHTSTSNEFGFGEATANLRGLGSPRTLVLVDGRRLVAARDDGVSDLNVIPPTLIESVEIVTGGASAVYGSDAIAGVINFKLKDDFKGLAVDGSWGQTARGDGEEYDVSLTAGTDFAGGRGSVTGSIGYSNRAQINASERDFSRVLLEYVGAGNGTTGPDDAYIVVPGHIRATEEGTAFVEAPDPETFESVFASYGFPRGTVPYDDNWRFGFNDDSSLFTGGNFEPGSVVNFRGDPALLISDAIYGYNFAPWQALQMPLERVSAFGSAAFEINEDVEAYATGLYADYTVDTQAAPPVLLGVFAPVTNPYIPPDLALMLAAREDPEASVDIGKRMSTLGPRDQENHTRMYQIVGGVRGILAGDWTYDLYAQFGDVDQTRRRDGEVRRSLAFELLHAPDGGVSICGGFDVFGPGSIQQGCADYVRTDVEDQVESRETIVEATFTGSPIELPSGPLRVVLGAAYRDHEFSYDGDEILAVALPDGGPDVPGFARFDFGADDENIDLYMEAGLPLLAGGAGVQSLEAVVGYRYSEYASAGGVDAWKAELLYRPALSLRLRGSYQQAARAPSINELYDPAIPDLAFFDEEDGEPCSAGSPQRSGTDAAMVEALCVAQGMPPSLLPTYFNDVIAVESGGNPDLDAERATTYTAGVVFQPGSEAGWLDGLQLSLDWYSIEIDDAIEFVSADEAVLKCFDADFNSGYRADSSWCSQFSRDTATGDIVDARGQPRNFASLRTSGIDLNLDWSIAAGPGRLHTGAFVSWIDSFETKASELAPADEAAGTVGSFAGSYPEWKWSVRLGYSIRALDAGVTWNYVDSMEDGSRFPFGELPENDVTVPHFDYFNLDFAYRFEGGALDGLELRAGVENLTDEDPPVFPSGTYYSTDPSQYDVLGRRYFTGLHYSF